VKKKKTRRTSKSVKNLPVKTANAKSAKRVRGGVSFAFAKVEVEYKPQKAD